MARTAIIKKVLQGLKLGIGFYLLAVSLSLITALVFTLISGYFFSHQHFKQAQLLALGGDYSLTVVQRLIGSKQPTVDMWRQSLGIIQSGVDIKQVMRDVTTIDPQINQKNFTPTGLVTLEKLQQAVMIIYQWAQATSFRQKILGSKFNQLSQLNDALPMVVTLYRLGLDQSVEVLFLLQNSDELRASGGFIGSLAWIKIDQQKITEPQFYDVYDLANRAPYLQPAPVGVNNYLSSGKGLTLADANWEAEFSQNGRNIQRFFDKLEVPQPDVVVAVNQSLIEELLVVLGPIELPNSQQTVYADNFAELARHSRSDFFAGDKQKKFFFQEFFTNLKLKMAELSFQQWLELSQTLATQIQQKQLLIYSSIPSIQEIASAYHLDGNLTTQSDYYLYLLESNVGINKANRAISRQVTLSFNQTVIKVHLDFFNDNQPLSETEKENLQQNQDLSQAAHLGYINYQRLITNLPLAQAQLICNGQPIEIQECTTLDTTQGEATQLGFLITTPEQTSTHCVIQLQAQQSLSPTQSWTIIRQPGLPPTFYRSDFFGHTDETVLTQDWLIRK